MTSDFLINKAIADYSMIKKDQSILVGFSGGPDSVCLLSFLYDRGYNVSAAHMNHNMRDTALRDLEFCRAFCEKRGIRLFEETVQRGSLKSELDARKRRYDFFFKIMEEKGIDLLATAHNKNDAAETVLLHMIRGASTDGLGGIAPVNGNIIRPLIYIKKSDVYEYIKNNDLSYVVDETNLTDIYSRNKLRNKFIPMLEEEFNSSLVDVIADNALLTAQDADYIDTEAFATYKRMVKGDRVGIAELRELHTAIGSRVLQLMWKKASGAEQNLSGRYIKEINNLVLKNKNGNGVDLPGRVRATVEYGYLSVEKAEGEQHYSICVNPEEVYHLPGGATFRLTENGRGHYIYITEGDKVYVRTRKAGDRFCPSGMSGTKKLSDYFTDMHVPRAERCKIPLVEINGEIAAVCGFRTDRRFHADHGGKKYYIEINN